MRLRRQEVRLPLFRKESQTSPISESETIMVLSAICSKQIYIAVQIMKLICKSDLEILVHNIHGNRKNWQTCLVDTEPLFGSLLLQERT